MKEIERIPEGVHIIPSRASDTDRERIALHLHEMGKQGRISMRETEKRIYYAANAQTWDELAVLIKDLPNLPVESHYWRDFDWDKPQ